jgi:hypothetical protein
MSEHQRLNSIAVDAVATFSAVVFATGLLAITVALIATSQGTTIADLYSRTFPHYRGTVVPMDIPIAARVMFVLYVMGAAQMAIVFRRTLAARRRRN